jgi:hypothetical protein
VATYRSLVAARPQSPAKIGGQAADFLLYRKYRRQKDAEQSNRNGSKLLHNSKSATQKCAVGAFLEPLRGCCASLTAVYLS